MRNWILVGIAFLTFLSSCRDDRDRLVGRWYNEDYWFEFYDDDTYDGGRDFLTEISHMKYEMLMKKHELYMYTNNRQQSYYLSYKFITDDTLILHNKIDITRTPVTYVRKKK